MHTMECHRGIRQDKVDICTENYLKSYSNIKVIKVCSVISHLDHLKKDLIFLEQNTINLTVVTSGE